jgi:multidrug efflux pump subunit AcrB
MNFLIRFSLNNPHAIAVAIFTVVLLGGLVVGEMPRDVLPAANTPAVQVLTFYGGMSASNVEKDITARMERWTGQAAGTARQESRSIVGASIIRNYYRPGVDRNGALTEVNSLASAAIPNLPPGTLPPVILPFDPTGTTPVCIVALDSDSRGEAELYDVGRYEVRNMIMASPGAIAPVVYGGKMRAVIAYLNREQMKSRNLAPLDVMEGIDRFNIFLPTGSVKFGKRDYALDSNSMYEHVEAMNKIPLRTEGQKTIFLEDVADAKDAALIQTNIVRVNGKRQVYIPVYRQVGSSTLTVVDNLKEERPEMQAKIRSGIELKIVMDQSVYVRNAIASLVQEGVLGAILCSLVILVFLGEWRLTMIAVLTIPVSVLMALLGLRAFDQTINVMTLAGLSLAIGPLVDSAIICLENTHRHLGLGARPREAAFRGASEVAMPELIASCCTLLVLAPLAFVPGLGPFLFRPMALAVAFAMAGAYLLSRSFVPMLCALWLRGHAHAPEANGGQHTPDAVAYPDNHPQAVGLFAKWEALIAWCISQYLALLEVVLRRRVAVLLIAGGAVLAVVLGVGSQLRREFFPEVDSGAFEIQMRAPTGTRLEETEKHVIAVERVIRETLGEDDLDTIICEVGVTPDWSAAYTPNSGPMDAVIKIQLKEHRERSAQESARALRAAFAEEPELAGLEFAFDTGGMIRGAMNEGKSTPLNVRITGKDLEINRKIAEKVQAELQDVDGVVDCRIMQRLDYPQYFLEIDRDRAAKMGLTQADVMRNVVAAVNSSIQFNKKNFWIDPVTHNQYYVGVQYPEKDVQSLDTLLQVPITGPKQKEAIPLSNLVTHHREAVPAELVHNNLQPTIDLTMNVEGRDLGSVADDVAARLGKFGRPSRKERGAWEPYDPNGDEGPVLEGSKIRLSGEYSRMQETFRHLGGGLLVASLLVYFLMAALFRSWLIPLVIISAVPVGLVGVVLMLFLTGTAVNVQSLLGVIFMVGIVVSNTVLLIDFAQGLRKFHHLTPTEAIRKAAAVRVRPVVMTALAAFFALLPMALGLERGSEASAPLGRAVIGGLLAGLATTLLVVPALFSLVVKGSVPPMPEDPTEAPHGGEPGGHEPGGETGVQAATDHG